MRIWAVAYLFWGMLCWGADPASELARAGQSPAALESFVGEHWAFDWAPLWQALGITGAVHLPACADRANGSDCSAHLISIRQPEQTIVLLRHEPSHQEVYLRFLAEPPGGWRFAGHYQPRVANAPGEHRTVWLGEKPHLAVMDAAASRKQETWLDLTQPEMRPVFRYTVEGESAGGPVSRRVRGKVVAQQAEPVESITVKYSVEFRADAGALRLGQREDEVVYTRQSGGGFVLDARAKRLYEDLDTGLSNEEFLRDDLGPLRGIAAGPVTAEKRWLRDFLPQCGDTAENRQVSAALQAR